MKQVWGKLGFICLLVLLLAIQASPAFAQGARIKNLVGVAGQVAKTLADKSNPSTSPKDGNHPESLLYDASGMIIGFNTSNLCAALKGVGGQALTNLCLEIYNCLRKGPDGSRPHCNITDCYNAVAGGGSVGDAYQQCKILCTIDPEFPPCGMAQCVEDLTCGPNPNWPEPRVGPCTDPPNGLFHVPTPMCCTTLLSPVDIGGDNPDIPGNLLEEACTVLSAANECYVAVKDNLDELLPPYDGAPNVPQDILDICCSQTVYETIDQIAGEGQGIGQGIKEMCYWSIAVDCAIEILDTSADAAVTVITGGNLDQLKQKLKDDLDSNGDLKIKCCHKVEQIKEVIPEFGNAVQDGCGAVNMLECAIAILQVAGVSNGENSCFCSNPGGGANGPACDPTAELEIGPLSVFPFFSVTHPQCGSFNPASACDAGCDSSIWDVIIGLIDPNVLDSLENIAEGPVLNYFQDSCCNETAKQGFAALGDAGTAINDALDTACDSLGIAECLNAIAEDFGIAPPDCTSCDAGSLQSFIDALVEGDVVAYMQQNQPEKTLTECCSSSEGIQETAAAIDETLGNIVEDICAAMGLRMCIAAFFDTLDSLDPGSCQSQTDDFISFLMDGLQQIEQLIHNITDPTKFASLYTNCCADSSVASAAESILPGLSAPIGDMCGYVKVTGCLRAIVNATTPDPVIGEGDFLSQAITAIGQVASDIFPPPPEVQVYCCGVSSINGQLLPAQNVVPELTALNPTLGNTMESVCEMTTAVACAQQFAQTFGLSHGSTQKACVGGKLDGNSCNSNSDCWYLEKITCSSTVNPANCQFDDGCTEDNLEGTCEVDDDETDGKTKPDMITLINGLKPGEKIFEQVSEHGLLPKPFDDACCTTQAYDAFDYVQEMVTGSLPPDKERFSYYLNLTCTADHLTECIAGIVATGIDIAFNPSDPESSTAPGESAVVDALGGMMDPENETRASIKSRCCANPDVQASLKSLLGDEHAVTKAVQTACDVIEILECGVAVVTSTENIIADVGALVDAIKAMKGQQAGSTQVQEPTGPSIIDQLDTNGLNALKQHCCEQMNDPLGRVANTLGLNQTEVQDGLSNMCKWLDVAQCSMAVGSAGYNIVFQATTGGGSSSGSSGGSSGASGSSSGSSGGGNNLWDVVQDVGGSVLSNIPGVVNACCGTIQGAVPAGTLLGDAIGDICSSDCNAFGSPDHMVACAIAYATQKVSPSQKFVVKGCCNYISSLAQLFPDLGTVDLGSIIDSAVWCVEYDPSAACYEVVTAPGDVRGVECQWVYKNDKRNDPVCKAMATKDFLYFGTDTASAVTSVNTRNCKCCKMDKDGDGNFWDDIIDGTANILHCLGYGCAPNAPPSSEPGC